MKAVRGLSGSWQVAMALVAGPMAGMVTVTAQAVDSPELVVVREDGMLKLEAGGLVEGRAYRIERSDTLGVVSWEGVGPSAYATNDSMLFEVPLDFSVPVRFLRLAEVTKGWVLVDTNGPSGGGIAAYDTDRNVTVMFACEGSYPSDTWEFDGAKWRRVEVPGPHGRDSTGKMVYDPVGKRMLMQGGWWPDNNDPWTWEYQVTGPGPDERRWVQVVQADCAFRGGMMMAMDTRRNQALHFGGNRYQTFHNDYWRFDCETSQWTRLGT